MVIDTKKKDYEEGNTLNHYETLRVRILYVQLGMMKLRKDEINMENIKGIILESAGPLNDGMRSYNKLYPIFGIIGLLIGTIIDGIKTGIGLMIVGLIVAFYIRALISNAMIESLGNIEFYYASQNTSQSYLMKLIVKPLSSLGMTIEMKTDGTPLIMHNGLQYIIHVSECNIFTIDCLIPLSKRMGHYSKVSFYEKAVVSMGLIAYTVQEELSNNK